MFSELNSIRASIPLTWSKGETPFSKAAAHLVGSVLLYDTVDGTQAHSGQDVGSLLVYEGIQMGFYLKGKEIPFSKNK